MAAVLTTHAIRVATSGPVESIAQPTLASIAEAKS